MKIKELKDREREVVFGDIKNGELFYVDFEKSLCLKLVKTWRDCNAVELSTGVPYVFKDYSPVHLVKYTPLEYVIVHEKNY